MLHSSAFISSDGMAAQVFTDRDESHAADLDVANSFDTVSMPDRNDTIFIPKSHWRPLNPRVLLNILLSGKSNSAYRFDVGRG